MLPCNPCNVLMYPLAGNHCGICCFCVCLAVMYSWRPNPIHSIPAQTDFSPTLPVTHMLLYDIYIVLLSECAGYDLFMNK